MGKINKLKPANNSSNENFPFSVSSSLLFSIPPLQRLSTAELSSDFISIEFSWHRREFAGRPKGFPLIAGLLYHRNSVSWLSFFCRHHRPVWDFLVILDDKSEDQQKVEEIVKQNAEEWKIAVLHRRKVWRRMNEWFDRNLLILTARQLGASHLVMLDIDEFISFNCAESGLARSHILSLNRSVEYLSYDWVELWGGPGQRRVAGPENLKNFLLIDFIGIWANSEQNEWIIAGTKLPNNGAAHVPRLPDSLRSRGRALPEPSGDCHILHHRFLNEEQFLLKGAWYEARGIAQQLEELESLQSWKPEFPLPAGLTTAILAQRSFDRIVGGAFKRGISSVQTAPVPSDWLGPEFLRLSSGFLFSQLATWRILQILETLKRFGPNILEKTKFASQVDWAAVASKFENSSDSPVFLSLPRFV